ncbi:MAG: response regulator [Candidatus Krumholzibacteriia bacterium]
MKHGPGHPAVGEDAYGRLLTGLADGDRQTCPASERPEPDPVIRRTPHDADIPTPRLERRGPELTNNSTIGILVVADEPDALPSDVVMPGMNGRDLSERIRALHPDLRCIFRSGYAANVIAHHGVLEPGVRFLEKPFSRDDLAEELADALADG